MTTVRLHVNNHGDGWALVQCPKCHDVHRYNVVDAAHGGVTCSCGNIMDVSATIIEKVEDRIEADHELYRNVIGHDPCDPSDTTCDPNA